MPRSYGEKIAGTSGPSNMATLMVLYVGTAFVIWCGLLVDGGRSANIDCPSSCSCLGHLVDCRERGLIEIPPDLPVWVEILELQNNDITGISDDAFKDLTNLQQLDLSHNQLRSINVLPFRSLPNLRELKIQHNHLGLMPELGNLPNLTLLSLHHNEIHSISLKALSGLPNLRTLDLNRNRIEEISSGSFPNETRLLHLYLNNNRIHHMEHGCLDSLTHLETLRLNKNRLILVKDIFKKLRSLKILELNRNRLTTIEALTFRGLESLQILRLQNNAIRSLLDGAFWGLNSIQELSLDYNNISVVAKRWLYGLATLQQLFLQHNRIVEIEDGWEFCQKLWELDLSYNRLQAIRKGTFLKLNKLYKLNLNHNRISFVEDGAFKGLGTLEILELNKNEISWTIEDMNGAFIGLDRLRLLDLESNIITSIAERAFVGLESLHKLHLGDNAITSIQNNSFQGMHSLKHLYLNSSSFLCDCNLQWLPEWLIETGFENTVTARCAHPEWLKGKSIFEIQKDDFNCDDFPKPSIRDEPQTQITLKGANVTLVCTAVSSSNSPMRFQWRKDNMNIKDPNVELYANTTTGEITEYRSVLLLRNISDKDEGNYQCIITNDFGSTYSQKAKITVHVFPVFLKKPADVTVKAGSPARLECAATGQPHPVIAWRKDGGDDFPAARERRMHIMSNDHVFFIVNVKISDMGMYSCTAENAAGLIMANATLKVLETPSFVKAVEDKKIVVGETAVLECIVKGSPKPKVTWTKDGENLVPSERHFFIEDNQLLIILRTQYNDEGTYTCELSNTLGTERGTAQLQVISGHVSKLEDESATTGILIIAVVCCVVGTSLLWVIIIYQTRKRMEYLSPSRTDESTLPDDLTYPTYPSVNCTNALRGSAAHLYLDNHSDHSSKDSGTGESTRQSHDALLPIHCQPMYYSAGEAKGLSSIKKTNDVRVMNPPSDSSLDTLSSIPSTRTTSSGDAVPMRPTNHERLNQNPEGWLSDNPNSTAEGNRWPAVRSLSEELPSDINSFPEESQGEERLNRGFATFPRNAPPQSQTWKTSSLRHLRLPREVQNDSGSFSIESEDVRPFQSLLLENQSNQRHSLSATTDGDHTLLTGIGQSPAVASIRLQENPLPHC